MDAFFLNQTWHAGTSSLGDGTSARHETDDRRVHWEKKNDHLTDKRMGIAASILKSSCDILLHSGKQTVCY